jgi:1-acyl-sn-glycerol-3-phosphate acyltransferase
VLKRELLWDPCLDLVGQRLPNAFVRRGQGGSEREIERVRQLGRDLGPREGVLVYPEGTRYTPRRRQQVIARLAETAEPKLVERARALQHVLPPRLGGVIALLDTAPDADVVIGAHTGFESLRTLADLWSGALVGRSIEVEFWRIPSAAIPRERADRIDWIYEQWARVDAWLDARGAGGAP